MAIGKPRGNKRSSNGSYSSTVSTMVLVTLCVLGIWILTSSNSAPSSWPKTLHTSHADPSSSIKLNRKMPVDVYQDTLVDLSTNTTVSEDNLMDVVVQNDDESKERNAVDMIQETGGDWLADIESEPKQEINSNVVNDDDAESLNDSDVGKQEAEEEQEIKIATSEIEDNTDGLEERKQQTQKTEEESEDSDMGNQEDKQTEDDIRELEDNQEQEMTDQEHEKRIENQHEDDGPIESHSIAAETRAQVENQEARDFNEKMEQAKIESTTTSLIKVDSESYKWELCNVTAGTDYIPCLDNEIEIRNLHQQRHCPNEPPVCLVPLPKSYKTHISWPQSRDKIWLHNVPNKALSDLKGHQDMVKVTGEFITFPNSALQYINFLQEAVPEISWGKHTRVVLNVGCGVASFGGYLFDKDVLTMSLAYKDEQESQFQFALERGIPAISGVMRTQRLPFPSGVYDLVHCVRCKVPWHKDGGILLLEVNRVLRPGGYFVWSATPVYRTLKEDAQTWKEMSALTMAMCWELVTIKKDKQDAIGVAIYHKPDSNECFNVSKKQQPPMCKPDDDPNASWYVPLQTCMHKVLMGDTERGSHWPEKWPDRVQKPPYWLNQSQIGIYGKPSQNDFKADYEHWKRVISKSYMSNLGINWSNIHNVMDMRAVYGGFAAALKDMKLWVLNVVNIDSPDTLPIIFERGLFGIYHDWCKSFSTHPRTYDLLHADHLFSKLKNRCKIKGVMAEIDRILRPGGNFIALDECSMIREMEKLLKSLHWDVNSTFTNKQGLISGRKSMWRPNTYVTPS